jgi:guanyl-specific ribonuclease Sa
LIYTARGDYVNAGLSAGSMIPFVGWASTSSKFVSKGSKIAKRANAASGVAKSIPTSKIDDLSQNAQNAYKKYDNAGWKGNVSGQTSKTGAGGKWRNGELKLPTNDAKGNKIAYRKFDVNNKTSNAGRDAERFVRGSDGSVYYTNDHYITFTKIN